MLDKRAKNFKIALAKKNLTQKELGKQLCITQGAVQNFYALLKRGGKPQPETVRRYAEALGIQIEKLL